MTSKGIITLASAALLWQLACLLQADPSPLLPSPVDVVYGLVDLLTKGMPPAHRLPLHIWYSLERVFFGVIPAVVLGVPLGLILGASPGARAHLMPLMNFLRPIPPLAWVPLAIVWFGIGMASASFLIFLSAFFPIVLNTCSGVRGVEKSLVEAITMLGANWFTLLRKVYLPGAMPMVMTGIRVGVGIGWMTLVAAEYTGVREGYGLGYLISSAYELQRMDEVVAGMTVIGLIGLCIDWGLSFISARLFRWRSA